MRPGIQTRPETTLLTERAARFLENGPADVVDLIGYICNLPAAPRIVAEHMAQAMFAGRTEFDRDASGKWWLVGPATTVAAPRPDTRSQPLKSLTWVVVDVETTGGLPPAHRMTEFAAVVVRNGEIAEEFETLINPQRPIPPLVSRLTNITWSMVKNAPIFSHIASDVMRSLEGHVFVAHNAKFDWNFVCHEVSRATGNRLEGPQLCTVRLARRLLPHLPRRSLDGVAGHYGIEINGRHRAGGDARATAECLIRLLRDAEDRGCTTWEDLEIFLGARKRKKKRRRPSALPSPVTRDTTA